jgi:hypothetical protein
MIERIKKNRRKRREQRKIVSQFPVFSPVLISSLLFLQNADEKNQRLAATTFVVKPSKVLLGALLELCIFEIKNFEQPRTCGNHRSSWNAWHAGCTQSERPHEIASGIAGAGREEASSRAKTQRRKELLVGRLGVFARDLVLRIWFLAEGFAELD